MPPRRRQAVTRPQVRKLTQMDVENIVGLIERWPATRVTWPSLVDKVATTLGHTWTRQALERHEAIKAAYQRVRDRRRPPGRRQPTDPAEVILTRRAEALFKEVEQLRRQLTAYEERFVRYEYNAAMRGLTPQELAASLPAIDRGRSESQKDA